MNDGNLSQDEIDALLKVSDEEENEDNPGWTGDTSDLLSGTEQDTIGEIGNISVGSSATTLSTLLNQKVEITTPAVSIMSKKDFENEFSSEQVGIHVSYSKGFDGQNILLMKSEDAAVISDIMLGGDGTSPDNTLQDIHISAIQETMNQMMGTAATTMSTVFNMRIDVSPPSISLKKEDYIKWTKDLSNEAYLVKVSFHLKVGQLIDSNIMQIIPLPFARQLVGQLMQASEENTQEAAATSEINSPAAEKHEPFSSDETTNHPHDSSNDETNPQYLGDKVDYSSSPVQQADFSELEYADLKQDEKRNLDMLLDIPLKVSVVLGRTQRSIKDILELSAGSIIELDKLAGEPVDILINEKLIAKGEVVVIDENFGVRVTDIISRSDRLMKLK